MFFHVCLRLWYKTGCPLGIELVIVVCIKAANKPLSCYKIFSTSRYKQKKDTEAKLSEIKAAVESGQADDEVVRDFYLLSIRKWIVVSLEEIESIDQEMEILKRMDVLKQVWLHVYIILTSETVLHITCDSVITVCCHF